MGKMLFVSQNCTCEGSAAPVGGDVFLLQNDFSFTGDSAISKGTDSSKC